MSIVIMGMALAFNLLIVLWKYQRSRYLDATLDGALLVLVGIVFSGSTEALAIGTIGSAIVSIYLLINPPKFKKVDFMSTNLSADIPSPKSINNKLEAYRQAFKNKL